MRHRHELTFVGRFDGRMIDQTLNDQMTRVGTIDVVPILHDDLRLTRGLSSLLGTRFIGTGQQQRAVHYGLIGPTGSLEGQGLLHGDADQVATAVIGRHSHADTRGDEDRFALRHALLVRPKHCDESLRVFDLSGFGGTTTLAGEPLLGARIELPFVLRLGPYLLVAFESAHGSLGAKGIIELSGATLLHSNLAGRQADRFLFTMDDLSRGNRSHSRGGDAEFPPTGEIDVTQAGLDVPSPVGRQVVFRPSADALARGFLLGRYERCGAPGAMAWNEQMSRVHALLFSVDDDVYLADLGSTNGTKHARLGDLRLKHIEDGDQFLLGETRLSVERCG